MRSSNQCESAGCVGFSRITGKDPNYCSLTSNNTVGTWIVDTGTTSYMYHYLNLFSQYIKPKQNLAVNLPNGSAQSVLHIRIIILNLEITLHNVLHVPYFK